ncbi:MAG TPA: IS1595 family transposase [Terriglobia bacterium]|nr:IS1595 family transposase [Terriglobia bacterium]
MKNTDERHNLTKSEVVENIPLACSDELAAVELFEQLRWGNNPACVHCGSVSVYKMMDAKTGERNNRFLWRCHDCKKQYTVRIGTVYEESRLDLRHWAYAFWRASTSKKGVAALEIMRHCQISYKSALFLMNRIRFAMAPENPEADKLTGTVECDETYVGGKPRIRGSSQPGRGTKKTAVFAAVERHGRIRRRVLVDVGGKTLKGAIREMVDKQARIVTDDFAPYYGIGAEYKGGHQVIAHSTRKYVRGDIYTNTAESSFAILKRGIMGIYHNVSKEYLHRYLWQFDFMWNFRKMNDGERTISAIQSAEGKRLMYRAPAA